MLTDSVSSGRFRCRTFRQTGGFEAASTDGMEHLRQKITSKPSKASANAVSCTVLRLEQHVLSSGSREIHLRHYSALDSAWNPERSRRPVCCIPERRWQATLGDSSEDRGTPARRCAGKRHRKMLRHEEARLSTRSLSSRDNTGAGTRIPLRQRSRGCSDCAPREESSSGRKRRILPSISFHALSAWRIHWRSFCP